MDYFTKRVDKPQICGIININSKSNCGSTAVQEKVLGSECFFASAFGKGGVQISSNSSKVSIAVAIGIVAVVLVASGILQLKGEV
jgi:hypothetical protein